MAQYYGVFDKTTGIPDGFYEEEINAGMIPENAVKVTEEQWLEFISHPRGAKIWDGENVVDVILQYQSMAPESVTLKDWRIALALWKNGDKTFFDTISETINTLVTSGNPLGHVATQIFEYSAPLKRSDLIQFKDQFGLTETQIDESLFRANQVSLGDFTGKWPISGK